jgi:hypothetical protein
LVDDSLPFTTDSADVSHDDVRLQDSTLQPSYRPRGDQHTSQALSSWEVRDQPGRSPADEPEDRGRMLELRPGPPVSPHTTFSREDQRRRQLLQNQVSIKRQQYEQAVLRFVHARPDIYHVSDAYLHREVQQPYVDEPHRAPVPAVKLEPELDPIPDAVGQPPFVPRTGRPTDS